MPDDSSYKSVKRNVEYLEDNAVSRDISSIKPSLNE